MLIRGIVRPVHSMLCYLNAGELMDSCVMGGEVHAWNYRRYILLSTPFPPPPTAELAYTTRKIEANFSNFSAWHQRSKVYTTLWSSPSAPRDQEKKSREAEFELVRNAMYTDPEDQSVWMYHRWLIGAGEDRGVLDREIGVIAELLDEQPDSKCACHTRHRHIYNNFLFPLIFIFGAGCMESIVHYKTILLRLHASPTEQESLKRECAELLGQLKEVDPARRRRYEELGESYLHLLVEVGC